MTKYYNANIPTEINVVYGNRYNGKTYYNFNKIKQENERLKEELELEKSISSNLARNILKAIEYIQNMPYAEIPDDYENNHKMVEWNSNDLLKILKGEE